MLCVGMALVRQGRKTNIANFKQSVQRWGGTGLHRTRIGNRLHLLGCAGTHTHRTSALDCIKYCIVSTYSTTKGNCFSGGQHRCHVQTHVWLQACVYGCTWSSKRCRLTQRAVPDLVCISFYRWVNHSNIPIIFPRLRTANFVTFEQKERFRFPRTTQELQELQERQLHKS